MTHRAMLPASRAEQLGFVARAALVIAAVFVGLFVFWRVREAFLLLLLALVVATVLVAAAAPGAAPYRAVAPLVAGNCRVSCCSW